jgi:hypothetical protein
MATGIYSQSRAGTLDVEELVGLAWTGRIRVPHFQRDFRWGWEDVRRLFDSIAKGYPIGSLLLWVRPAPAQMLQLGALRIVAEKATEALWVVDGQQRITSLANALHPEGQRDPRFALSYNLSTGEFVRTPPVEDPLIIPLPALFDLQQIIRWFANYPGISEHLDTATSVTRRIRQFQVPAYRVTQDDPKILQDIFDRMNNYGKRLSRAEIFAALNVGDETDESQSLGLNGIASRIDTDFGFGVIDEDTVLSAVLARRGPDVTRDIRKEFSGSGDEGREVAFKAGEEALRRTVQFLQTDADVPHITMLAYRYLLVVLARIFAFHPDPDPRNRRLLRRWYWRAAVAGPERFKGDTVNAARILCAKVNQHDLSSSVQDILDAVSLREPVLPDLSRFSTNQAVTKMVLCAWWAAGPRSPETGSQYQQDALAETLLDQKTARDAVRYLVPRHSLPEKYRRWAGSRALMPVLNVDTKEVPALLASQSIDLDSDTWQAMLTSHAVSVEMSRMLATGDSERFVAARQETLNRNLEHFLSRMCEWNFEDTPPLSDFIIDDEAEDVTD